MQISPYSIYTLIKEIFLILDEGDQFLFGQHGLSVTRFYALDHLSNQPGLALHELSKLMLTDKSNVTRFVRALEADSLIVRQKHESDGRSQRLFLTEEGKALHAKVHDEHTQFNQLRFETALQDLKDDDEMLMALTILKEKVSAEFQHITAS